MQDFLNGVCTHTIWITRRKLTYYTGELSESCTIDCLWHMQCIQGPTFLPAHVHRAQQPLDEGVKVFGLIYCVWVAGNYDTFLKTVRENETIQAKQYAKEQDDIK